MTGVRHKLDVAKHRLLSPRIGESQASNFDSSFDEIRNEISSRVTIRHFNGFFKQVENPIETGEIGLEVGGSGREGFDGAEQHDEVGQEHDQIAGRDLALDHLEAAVK